MTFEEVNSVFLQVWIEQVECDAFMRTNAPSPIWVGRRDRVIQAPVYYLHIQSQGHNELGTCPDSLQWIQGEKTAMKKHL